MVPRIFGPYEPIRRDYPIEEYLADVAGSGVEKSVYVQANWARRSRDRRGGLGAGDADAHGWPHAMVGYADLLDDDVGETLQRQAAYPADARHAAAAPLARRTRNTASRRGPT